MKACIVGASGYTGRELVSLLLDHPHIELAAITSRALAGKSLQSQLPHLRNKGSALAFSNPSIESLCKQDDINLFFLALPHGTSATFAKPLVESGKKVIDLSADFRLGSSEIYEEFYGGLHPAPDLLVSAQYALPELYSLSWKNSSLLAAPGCYPTSIILPLAPLLKENLIEPEDIVVNSMSGISGAGRTPSENLLFCERNENACAYGLPKHRHLSEIEEQLSFFNGDPVALSFHPHLAPINRGICTTISAKSTDSSSLAKIVDCWHAYYKDRPFVKILDHGIFPEVKHVVGTNGIDIAAHIDSRTKRITICSTEDNLIKGAGGQAIQAMNICQGYNESAGLK
ncbi:MAG: N-acetyl-gamma-glutamyl-phosphate reductase [Opitutales bacterium]|nr:N-acetyl-gamma-glutamyl-phosphate reductase [Opitutales bacterium]